MQIPLKNTDPQARCHIITIFILLVGWSSALVLYLTAEAQVADPFAEFENSKRFVHELERMGGKAAVVANDFSKWFNGLWHGESLAYMVAVITVVIACGYYFIVSAMIEADDE